jgi:hypothetical protein
MATRSRIGIQKEDGSVTSIYCHWDGYPDHNGKILLSNYTEREKVEELIALGSISSLRKDIAPAPGSDHSFEKPQEDVTIAYHRDRGEDFNEARVNESVAAYLADDNEEYGYLFTKAGEWKVSEHGGDFKSVTDILNGVDEEEEV